MKQAADEAKEEPKMMKEVLIIYYSQSGQLKELLEHLVQPLQKDDQVHLTYYAIEPKTSFPFPWSKAAFFNTFPETFQQIAAEIIAPDDEILRTNYDLIILGYQVWYLSPSIPINSFLKTPFARQIMSGKPTITIVGCRNMWVMAQEKIKTLLRQNDATPVGHITFADRHINLVSVITIVDWMFSGIKRKVYGFLPLPGVSTREIKESGKFGELILPALRQNDYKGLQNSLVLKGAVEVRHFLVSMDKKANKMFNIWSKTILKNDKKRTFLLRIFNYYLYFAIWVVSPIAHLVHLLLYPFTYWKIKKEKKYFQGIE